MKFIICRECFDSIFLARTARTCRCGKSSGMYVDELRAQVTGPATAFGIHSEDLGRWLYSTSRGIYPEPYKGEIRAWCMPEHPTNIEYVDALPVPEEAAP